MHVRCSLYTVLSRVDCRPPKCLTCPCYLRGQTPCIGIITVLSNLDPFDVEGRQKSTVSDWLQGNSLLRPEIFQNRWRTDKDPTKDLATYSAILKQPLSRSVVADDRSHAVLEQDVTSQFNNDMAALSTLDQTSKQHALRQLKPIMARFSSTVAKFVADARIMKTCQGRGACRSNASIIARKTPSSKSQGPSAKPMYSVNGSAASSISCAKGYGAGAPVSGRSRPGNNHHIADKWTCPLCKTSVKNCTQSIKQHKGTTSHRELQAKMHFCEVCNIYCDNVPAAIQQHNESYDHGHQRRLGADMQRDGSRLANIRRDENDGQVQVPNKKQKSK